MKMYLISKDLWEIVTGAEVMDSDLSDTDNQMFKKHENQVFAAIYLDIYQKTYRFTSLI